MQQDRVCFFYPTKSVGGAQYLFARMAEYLIDNTPYDIILIDYKDGFIRNKLAGKDYRFIEYRDENIITIQEPLLLVLPLSFLSLIKKYFVLSKTTRLFFWDLHPYNLVEQMALSGFYKQLSPMTAHRICTVVEHSRCKRLAHFVAKSSASHGLAFMAERNRYYNQQLLGFSTQVKYLPIPVETLNQGKRQGVIKKYETGSTIHVGWLSRLDSWKVSVLFRVFDDIKAYENEHGPGNIHIHVIGDGPEHDRVQAECVENNASMAGRLEGDSLTEYMLSNLHVGFAMGTSALEFAVRGIPTVLTPIGLSSANRQQDRIYRWLFDSHEFDVTSEEMKNPESLHSFSQVIQSIQEATPEYLGEKCNTYTIENHDVDKVGALLVEYLSHCNLTYGDVHQLGIYQLSLAEHILFGLKGLFKSGYAIQKQILSLFKN